MTGTKLWRVLDKRETFFWFRVSVSIEKKNWKIKPVKVEVTLKIQVTFKFFFYLSLAIKQELF